MHCTTTGLFDAHAGWAGHVEWGGMRETVSNLLDTKATGPWLQSLSIGTTIPLLVMYDGRDANMQPHVLGTCFRLGECVPARSLQ